MLIEKAYTRHPGIAIKYRQGPEVEVSNKWAKTAVPENP